MSDNDESTGQGTAPVPENDNPPKLQDLALDLNFVPGWARKPSTEITTYEERGRGRRGDREGRTGRDRFDNQRRGGASSGRGEQRGGQGRREEQRRDGQGRPQDDRRDRGQNRRNDDQRQQRHGNEERIHLPVDIHFIPDRDRLGAVVRQLHMVRRAFPLVYVAGLFLKKPEFHMLKLEARAGKDGTAPMTFFQCRESKAVFLTREEIVQFLVKHFLDRHFERVELQVDPPNGNFVCVGRCKRSGVLLGPPNYHGYNERLMDTHRTHFPGMSLDQYRGSVEMVRDPAVIEQWKESCRTQVRYRSKDTPDAPAELTLMEAESQFIENYAPAMIHATSKVILPGAAIARMTDEKLKYVLQSAWLREDRFPLSLMLALRPAFRRMRLHLFKAGKDETFVTAIPPKPLDAEHAIPEIKEMVALISDHPGWSRKQLVEKLYPGKSVDDPEVMEKLNPLAWLIDKGHIIEFFNGTYAIPGHLRNPGAVPSEKPQEHHHPEVAPGVNVPVDTTEIPDMSEETVAEAGEPEPSTPTE